MSPQAGHNRPIKAIETRAYGCRFRSRLEARYAVFFTHAGFRWEYEPEGVELDAGRYLPDFRVTRDQVTVWLEVKSPAGPEDDPRWSELAMRSGQMVFVVYGLHRPGDRCAEDHGAKVYHPSGDVALVHRLWQGRQYAAAWTAANEARFERGEQPGKGRRR